MIVAKFGGTSVQDAEAISRVIEIVRTRLDEKPIVVVSALSKVTDMLYKIVSAAGRGDMTCAEELVEELGERHLGLTAKLLEGSPFFSEAKERVELICDRLRGFVKAVCIVEDMSPRSMAKIISRGEVLSSTIISFVLNDRGIATSWVDARKLIITDGQFMKGEPRIDAICAQAPAIIEEAFKGVSAVITQGFVAGTSEGETTVLGRGGSDYSASLIGMAVHAERVEIWTDVNGVMTADPRVVSKPQTLPRISFEEAAEMAYFGAKVLHPMTIEPAVKEKIPIYVLNSRNADQTGTGIFGDNSIPDGVKAVSSKENIAVINVFSPKMINVAGFLSKVFGIFSDNKVSVDLVSTSEANISITVDSSNDIEAVVEQLSSFARVTVDKGKSQISIIGKNIIGQPHIIRDIFTALDGRPVYMISQDSTFINISLVVDRAECKDAVRAIHEKLFE